MKKSRKLFTGILLSLILAISTVTGIYMAIKPLHSYTGKDDDKEVVYDKEKTSYDEYTYESDGYIISSKGYTTSSKEEHDKILKRILSNKGTDNR